MTAADHDRRHWKAAKVDFPPPDASTWYIQPILFGQALIFVMPLLGVGHILTLVVKPTVGSIGVPLVVDVFEAVEAVIMSTQVIVVVIMMVIMVIIFAVVIVSTQGFVISLPYCFLNSEVRGAVRSQWRRWRMVR